MTDLAHITGLPPSERIEQFHGYLDRRRATEAAGSSEDGSVVEVFGYRESREVLQDHRTFSNDVNAWVPQEHDQLARAASGHLAGIDPPRHTLMRGLVNKAFTPATTARLSAELESTAGTLLDVVLADAADRNAVDVVGRYAAPLTARMIAELFGIPHSDHRMFATWADSLLNAKPAGELGIADEQAMASVADLVTTASQYLVGVIAERRKTPQDDLTSNLARAEVDGRRLGDDEIVGLIGMFLIAGYLPGSVLIGNTVMCLLEHPEALRAVRSGSLPLDAVIEEVMRWRPPLVRDQRVSTTDTAIGGQAVPAGSPVCVWTASANRDDKYFADPGRFDPYRTERGHLTLGRGIHFCLGSSLTRLETTVAVGTLLSRVEEMCVEGAEFHRSIGLLGPSRLDLSVTPL